MSKGKQAPYFSYLVPPKFEMSAPDKLLSESEYELLRITVEDFRFVTREMTDCLGEVPAEIRARSTILRRLLSERDLFNTGRIFPPKEALRVKARMLDFDPPHPGVLLSCGNYPWADDRLEGIAAQFSVTGVPIMEVPTWSYREDADVTLNEYLDGLAFSILGTPIRRREVIKYVGDKKSAHVSDRRKHQSEQAIDRAWSHLSITIASSEGERVQLNLVYLEMLALIEALTSSVSINGYIDDMAAWLETAKVVFPEAIKTFGLTLPMAPR